jgi:hypothetical protein
MGQRSQYTVSSFAAYEPGVHGVQASCRKTAENVPAAHTGQVKFVLLFVLYIVCVPGRHPTEHCEVTTNVLRAAYCSCVVLLFIVGQFTHETYGIGAELVASAKVEFESRMVTSKTSEL